MKTLVFWGRGPVEEARRRHAEGAILLATDEERADALRRDGLPCRTAISLLGGSAQDAIDEAAIAWTKAWGTRPIRDGKSFRDLYRWKDVSLWWFAELYLHHSTASPRHVRLIETFHRVLEAERPDEVEVVGLGREERLLLARTCIARGVLFHGDPGPSTPARREVRLRSLESRLNTAKAFLAAVKASLGRAPSRRDHGGAPTILFLSHAAFWRTRRDPETDAVREYEHYFDRLIPEAAADPEVRVEVLAVGPRAAFRRRRLADRLSEWLRLPPGDAPYRHVNRYSGWRVFREVRRATGEMRRAWGELQTSPGVHEAFSHRGVAFADLALPDLAGTLLLQLPWAVRCYEEMSRALEDLRPDVVCLYAESSGWGRAAVAACRARGVPAVAIQHGILYPKYYSYLHGPDEADCPRPHRTAVFGEAARLFLVEKGHYAPETLVVTGSPKFDDLLRTARTWDRGALRQRYGVADGEPLLAVASRYRGIRETHQSIGTAFAGLVRAVESLDGVRCLVKPHPAEPASAYEEDIRKSGSSRVGVVPAGTDLMELLHAADALVTVESLSAVEALVLGRPILILNTPTNLQALVDQGVAVGVAAGEDPLPAVRDLLFDPGTRDRLAAARRLYLSDLALGVDGGATARILTLLKQTADDGGQGSPPAEPKDGPAAGHGRV